MSETAAPPPPPPGEPPKVTLDFSPGLADYLAQAGISLAFTSYQSGYLYLVGHSPDGKLAVHEAFYPQAMGVVGDAQRIYLGTLTQLVRLENVLAPNERANGKHDRLYIPRNMQVMGNIDFHELGIRADGGVVVVNTRYSCLCEPSLTHSFRPLWKPDFISVLAPEDRCHLNGLAMVDGQPRYVTAVARSDVKDGWRPHRRDGGMVIDIASDRIVAQELSMPHSPRWHEGELWVLNSGTGELGRIDLDSGRFDPLCFQPGFLRGLALFGNHALIGLSKPRDGRFEGLALDETLAQRGEEARCGIAVVSLETGALEQWFYLEGAIGEIFSVAVLPGVANALTIGPQSREIAELVTFERPTWES